MGGGERTRRQGMAWRIGRHVLGGLLTGAAVGYLAALVLPRRHRPAPGAYRAPIPTGAGLVSVGDHSPPVSVRARVTSEAG